MAANKFATMLNRNTNKITLILIYALLEWTLIILLLLNSLFSYMIIKFAEYFGLKPPCPLCSRVDHLFEHGNKKTLRGDLLCEAHAKEISKVGFCSNHQKLVESQGMCEDCSSSRPDFRAVSGKLDLFPCMKEIKLIHNGEEVALENGDMSLKCSCCDMNLESKFSTPYILITPSWDDLENTVKTNSLIEAEDDDLMDKSDNLDSKTTDFAIENCRHEGKSEDQVVSAVSMPISEVRKFEDNVVDCLDLVLEGATEYIEEQYKERVMKDQAVQACVTEDSSLPNQHLEFFIECSSHNLVPVELIDSTTEEARCENQGMGEDYEKNNDEVDVSSGEQGNEEMELVVQNKNLEVEEETTFSFHNIKEEPKFAVLESMVIEEDENGFSFYAEECHSEKKVYEKCDTIATPDSVQIMAERIREEKEGSDISPVSEEVSQMLMNETDAEVLIGTEIPDLNLADELQCQVTLISDTHKEPSSTAVHFHEVDQHGPDGDQEKIVELRISSVEFDEHVMNYQSSISSKFNETEEDKVPETPASTNSFQQLSTKLLLLEKKDSGNEESLDGSVISELEGGDTVSMIEHLKSALKAERKALHTLYTELEEERSASAVAANQTMAMINKLQEEKAEMQMEALQYQRMMEEQSEYDQEALQLLNELMVKREKEKQELEKELDVYRKRLLEYESKEKLRTLKRSKDGSARSGFSSASCSNAEDSDELSIDLNQEAKEDDSFYVRQECETYNHVDAVLELEESFVDFEEERMSILEQLKLLEEKLVTMDDEEAKQFEDVRPMEDSFKENGNHTKEISHLDGEINEHANGFPRDLNGKHHQLSKIVNAEGKGLLPLFDAMSDENGDAIINGLENGFGSNSVHDSNMVEFNVENKNLAVEEELDYLHERLQALEADREFLKNCISSLRKGDKGMDLLHEILQHLRDLRNVDLRVRSSSNGLIE